MYKYILAESGNINWMAIFALLTFFWIFTVSAITIFLKKKTFIDQMANLPLDSENAIEK